jgi:hypothetical protein
VTFADDPEKLNGLPAATVATNIAGTFGVIAVVIAYD